MVTNRRRGTDFERTYVKRSTAIGWVNAERQPLSGQLPMAKFKLDVKKDLITPDTKEFYFLVSCKKTLTKNKIGFNVAWLEECEFHSKAINRIPLLAFAFGTKAGQKLTLYEVISEEEYIKIVGDLNDIVIKELKFRGKKYITLTNDMLNACRFNNGNILNNTNKIPVSCMVLDGKRYFIFVLEELYQAFMREYGNVESENRWF